MERINSKMKKTMETLICYAFVTVLLLGQALATTHSNDSNEIELELVIRCPKTDIKTGDEIPIIFTITNTGRISYTCEIKNYDRSGRIFEYQLLVKDQSGEVVPDPREEIKWLALGGLSAGQGKIKTGESFTKTIVLNRWALICEPGRYTVTGTYYSEAVDANGKQIIVESAPIEILVESRTDEEMAHYIEKLAGQLKAIKAGKEMGWQEKYKQAEKREEVLKKLMFTCDSRIIPVLIDFMYEKHNHRNEMSCVNEAFAFYLQEKTLIKDAIFESVKKRGLAPEMLSTLILLDCKTEKITPLIPIALDSNNPDIVSDGAQAAAEYPDDSYMPRLISLALDPNHPARWDAIGAIANNRTDEGVKTLKVLLEDPDKMIREITTGAIRSAYDHHRVYPEHCDDEYTAELAAAATDFKEPYAVLEILKTRDKESIEAIKGLLDDPSKDIPLAATDKGVKAIKTLLNHPDEIIRTGAIEMIKSTYRTYRGRPLSNDDFGEEFKENPEERKKKVLKAIRSR